jgi:hypothetical protein
VTEAEVIAAVSQLVHEGYEYVRVTDSTGTVAADVVVGRPNDQRDGIWRRIGPPLGKTAGT